MIHARSGMTAALAMMVGACAIHPATAPHHISVPAQWDHASGPLHVHSVDEQWWVKLADPVIDRLVNEALSYNPTLLEALARVDQARAGVGASEAARLPRVDVSGSVGYGQQNIGTTGGASATSTTTAIISPSLSWEIDLWGRVRNIARAAENRLDARTVDARAARLSIAAEVASSVLRLRACNHSLEMRGRDIVSRRVQLSLIRTRLSFGAAAPVEEATAQTNLSSAETERLARQEACARERNALVALTGVAASDLRALLPEPAIAEAGAVNAPTGEPTGRGTFVPIAPPIDAILPATVLLDHPAVIAAEREAAARWSEIGVAKAERLPRLDLAAILTGQWLRALGTSSSFATWSVGPQASGTLFDGGAGSAEIGNAEARYREAAAALEGALRTAVREIEDGLAAQLSASERKKVAGDALAAARFALTANEIRWQAGAIDQFELEDARRQFSRAQESAIDAQRDDSLAWVELVRASGNGFALPDGVPARVPQGVGSPGERLLP